MTRLAFAKRCPTLVCFIAAGDGDIVFVADAFGVEM